MDENGQAGASARAKYDSLRGGREARVSERFPRAGKLLVNLFGDTQTERNWKRGAEAEERIAAFLERKLDGSGINLLHDRRVPRSTANIDHIAIGPGGIFVIDTKCYSGRAQVERTGLMFGPRREKLLVNGRDRTRLIDGLEKQIALVRTLLDEPVPV